MICELQPCDSKTIFENTLNTKYHPVDIKLIANCAACFCNFFDRIRAWLCYVNVSMVALRSKEIPIERTRNNSSQILEALPNLGKTIYI